MAVSRLELKRMKGSLHYAPVAAGALVSVTAHADFAVTTGSVEMWMQCNSCAGLVAVGNLFTMRIDDSNYLQLIIRVGATLAGQLNVGAAGVAAISATSTGYSFDNGRWHHIVLTWGVGGVFIYANGLQVATQAGDKHTTWGSNPAVCIGNWITVGNPFWGNIMGARFYNVALTAAQVIQRYQGINILTGLVSSWNFDEMTGTTVTDTVSGHNGTISDLTKIYWVPASPLKERVQR
jgi:hypothetical protein